jgi:hypothetical protein
VRGVQSVIANEDALRLWGCTDALHGAPANSRHLAGRALVSKISCKARPTRGDDDKSGRTWRIDRPTPHDLRRTVATRLAELGITKEDRDAVLNHTPRDVGKIHYDLYDREREKRQALDRWAHALSAIREGRSTGAEIVLLRRTESSERIGKAELANRPPRRARS